MEDAEYLYIIVIMKSLNSMKKSNIFAYVELKKLVESLNQPERPLKEMILTQVAYFHILDPMYFSDELAPEWVGIRDRLGYSSDNAKKGQQFLKNTMLDSLSDLTESDFQEIATRLKGIFKRLSIEFENI